MPPPPTEKASSLPHATTKRCCASGMSGPRSPTSAHLPRATSEAFRFTSMMMMRMRIFIVLNKEKTNILLFTSFHSS